MKRPMKRLLPLLMLLGGRLAQAQGLVRDVRPTTWEVGDTLVVECTDIQSSDPVVVTLSGLTEAGLPLTLRLGGRVASGDRVLVDIDEGVQRQVGRSVRLHDVAVLVARRAGGDPLTLWQSQHPVDLNLFPASLAALTAKAQQRMSAGIPAVGRLPGSLFSAFVVLLLGLVIHMLVAPLTGIVVVWERKISGRMQSRFGPNRVGPGGWLQWLADAVKMITKEDLMPTEADPLLFRFSPYLMWMSIFATFVVLPLSQTAIVADMNIGLLYLGSVTSLTVVAILVGGWASNSKWSLLGGMRSAAQIVSYEIPASLALLQVALLTGSLSPQEIIRAQGGLPHQWFLFANPLTFGCFFIYFISALAEGNRSPFDLPEAESELVSGYNTEYSGFRFGIFSLAEWTNMYVLSTVASATFLGGWNVPFATAHQVAQSLALTVLSTAIMITKIVSLVFVIIWIRWTMPRFRVDQMMNLCWKYFIPLAFVAFLGTAGWIWLVHAIPALDLPVRLVTFAVGGIGLGGLFVARVVGNFRATHLLYVGKRQFSWPWAERFIDKG